MNGKIIDDFLIVDVFLVAFLISIDWLLGSAQRRVIKERVAGWYVYLADVKYGAMLQQDAIKVKAFVLNKIGPEFFSKERFWVSFPFSLLVLLGASYFFNKQFGSGLATLLFFFFYFPFFLFLSLAFISFTNFVLNLIAYSSSFVMYLLVAIFVLFFSTFVVPILAAFTCLPAVVLLFGMVDLKGDFFDLLLFCASCGYLFIIPLELYLVFTYYLIFSKLTGMMLRGPVSLVVLRLYESEKGILSQVALILGGGAKLVQESFKYFNS